MKRVWQKVTTLLRTDPVLTISALLAVLSMFFIHPSAAYLSYIDFKTLACLFGLMASVMGLLHEGVLERVSLLLSARLKDSRTLTLFLVFSCYFFAMFVTNDVALVAIIPMTLIILATCGFENQSAFIVVLQTIAANIGSALTPIGNPQNLYLFSYYQMNLADFLSAIFPIALAGGLLLALCCLLIPVIDLKSSPATDRLRLRKRNIVFYSVLFLISTASVFDWIPYSIAALIVFVALLITNKHILAKVDYSLLATFTFIFIFVGNIGKIDSIHSFLSSITQENTLLAAILTSQITSNVPAAILLSGFTDQAYQLLQGVNIGGMGTLIASMASVISYKIYIAKYRHESYRYLKLFTFWNLLFLVALSVLGILLQ